MTKMELDWKRVVKGKAAGKGKWTVFTCEIDRVMQLQIATHLTPKINESWPIYNYIFPFRNKTDVIIKIYVNSSFKRKHFYF